MKTNYMLVSIASLALLAACEQQADDSAMEAPDTAPVADNAGMALPATTSSDVAREHYMAGWADFENARFNAAQDKFLQAAAEDPSFAMAHMMAALSATSTESFVSNLRQASAHKAEATAGEQLIVGAFERSLESDAEGTIAALEELTTVHPDSSRATAVSWQCLRQHQQHRGRASSLCQGHRVGAGPGAGTHQSWK